MRIEARGISFTVAGTRILDHVDLRLPAGGLTGLIGPNGAGKTTLLRILADVLAPTAGEVLYEGCKGGGRRERARTVAYLAQGAEVNWLLRVDELVALGRLPHRGRGGFSARDAAAVTKAMRAAGASELGGRTVATLSGGERMRVLLARALAVEPRVLLADEPVAALDPFHQLRVMEMLRETADRGTGVVAVLHDLTLAHRFCDRLVLMDRGRVVADGLPDEVLTDAWMEAVYGVGLLRGAVPGRFVLPWTRRSERRGETP